MSLWSGVENPTTHAWWPFEDLHVAPCRGQVVLWQPQGEHNTARQMMLETSGRFTAY
jgi:hypothetical protein